MTDGAQWLGQRNFTVKQLRNFGFGKRGMEEVITKQANDLVDHIKSLGNIAKVDGSLFAISVLNVLWEMVVGYAFDRDDKELQKVLELNNFIFSSKLFIIATTAPWVRFIFPSLTGYNKRLEALLAMRGHIREEIRKHEKDLDEDNPRDFIDAYLIEIKKKTDPEFCEEQLIMIGFDLMSAGSETTASTLVWAILYLVLHPSVQDRCYEEIEENIGQASVALADSGKLNYCQATIAEVQRLGQVAVASLQHRVTKQVHITATVEDHQVPMQVTLPTGHVVPEGSLAMSNIKAFLTDPLLWDKPEIFNPDR